MAMLSRHSRVQFEAPSTLGTWMETGVTNIEPGSVTNDDGLVENTHFEVDYPAGRIRIHTLPEPDPETSGPPVGITGFSFTGDPRATLPAPPNQPNFGNDTTDPSGSGIADAVQSLRQYLAIATPTTAQNTSALKLLIRLVLYLIRRVMF